MISLLARIFVCSLQSVSGSGQLVETTKYRHLKYKVMLIKGINTIQITGGCSWTCCLAFGFSDDGLSEEQ